MHWVKLKDGRPPIDPLVIKQRDLDAALNTLEKSFRPDPTPRRPL